MPIPSSVRCWSRGETTLGPPHIISDSAADNRIVSGARITILTYDSEETETMKQTIKSSNDDLSAIQEADVPNLDYVIYRDVIKSIPAAFTVTAEHLFLLWPSIFSFFAADGSDDLDH